MTRRKRVLIVTPPPLLGGGEWSDDGLASGSDVRK